MIKLLIWFFGSLGILVFCAAIGKGYNDKVGELLGVLFAAAVISVLFDIMGIADNDE